MNKGLQKEVENFFEKDLFKLMSNSVIEKSVGNIRKQETLTSWQMTKEEIRWRQKLPKNYW